MFSSCSAAIAKRESCVGTNAVNFFSARKNEVEETNASGVKVTEGFGSLVDAYQAGVSGHPDDVITYANKAYDSSIQAIKYSESLKTIATSMQQIAHNMAEEARALQQKTSK